MNRKQTGLDWAIAIIALAVILGLMGTLESEEQALNAEVLEETKNSARADMLDHKREMAAIDARARYVADYDLIQLAEVRP